MSSGGYAIDNGGGSGGGNTAWFTTSKIIVTSAEILLLNTTPKILVAAPGANKIIVPVRVVKRIRYAGTPYAVNLTLQVRYSTAGTPLMNDAATLTSIATRRTDNTYIPPAGTTNMQYIENDNLILNVNTGNPTLGNSDMDVWVTYYILDVT